MDSLLYFILGILLGVTVALFVSAVASARRISRHARTPEKRRRQSKRLQIPPVEIPRTRFPGADLCVCCGEPVPEGQMVCTHCVNDNP